MNARALSELRAEAQGEPKAACIIGAGSSGMVAVKSLRDAGVDFDCFEKTSVIGGNWAFGSPWSAAYRTLHINSYRKDMEYADFPMPAGTADFPHHLQVRAYFDGYVDQFGLRPFITFNTGVEHAVPRTQGGWEVTLSTGEARAYRFLIVACGHHNDPRLPEPPFPGVFEGVEMHAHHYRDISQLNGKNVVVVGMGNSAMDIAVESSYVAKRTYLSSRRPAYIIPKYILGRPSLPIPPWLPWQVRQFLLQAVRAAVGPVERYGLAKPQHKILQTHPTVSDTLLSRLSHGAVTPKPNIAELSGGQVRFTDGTTVEADTIVYCTGYRITDVRTLGAVLVPRRRAIGPLLTRPIDPAPAATAMTEPVPRSVDDEIRLKCPPYWCSTGRPNWPSSWAGSSRKQPRVASTPDSLGGR